MSVVKELYKRFISAMEVEGLIIPTACIKFFSNNEIIPKTIAEYHAQGISLTSCQANKQASLGDVVLITKENIGCIAAAITFGLVDANDDRQFSGSRVYTDIMKDQSNLGKKFKPPSPKDFTEGNVYACKDTGHLNFCLFGEKDSGRFASKKIAQKAIADMCAIQPATMQGVFFYTPDFDDIEIEPNIITMSVRPVELTRIIQGWQYLTGERIEASMGPVRVVNSDLIVRPYLTGKINVSTYCLGARLIAKYEANRMGIGIPYKIFSDIVRGLEESKTGYPFQMYPGAKDC